MTPPNQPAKTHLIFQGNIPFENAEQAEELYNEIKTFVKSWGDRAVINGQVITHLEPCCGQFLKGQQNAKILNFPK